MQGILEMIEAGGETGSPEVAGPVAAAPHRARHPRRMLLAGIAIVVAAALVSALIPSTAKAYTGTWKPTGRHITNTTTGGDQTEYQFVGDDGTVYATLMYNQQPRASGSTAPTNTPDKYTGVRWADGYGAGDGWELSDQQQETNDRENERAEQNAAAGRTDDAAQLDDASPVLGEFDKSSGTWANQCPDTSLFSGANATFPARYNTVRPVADASRWLASFAGGILGIIDPSKVFSAELDGPEWKTFYTTAKGVSDSIAVPFGTAFLVACFVMTLIRLTDSRKYHGNMWMHGLLRAGVLYAVSYTFILHAVDLVGAVYWVGQQLYRGCAQAVGDVPTLSAVGDSVVDGVTSYCSTITYGNFALVFVILILSVVLIASCFRLVVNVIVTAVLRMAEVFLRCAFAAVPIAFAASDATRPMAMRYLKRLASVCGLAAVLVVALSMAGSVITVVSNITGGVTAAGLDATLLNQCAATFGLVIGTHCITAIVRRASDVSNSVFGLN